MPTYEYECNECGHRFDAFQSMTAKPLRTCPECGGKIRRLISGGAAVIFKGSGFYETDYKRASVSSQSSSESSGTVKSDGERTSSSSENSSSSSSDTSSE